VGVSLSSCRDFVLAGDDHGIGSSIHQDHHRKAMIVRASPENIAEAAGVLRSGGVVAFPTDTLYGLAADPRRDDAVRRLFALKGRQPDAAVPLIAADLEQSMTAGEFRQQELRLARAFWPGPLSIVVPARPLISRAALGGGSTLAIRVPAHAAARELAAAFGFPITATSANASGEPPAETADDVASAVRGVDLILDDGRVAGGPPSTIVRFDDEVPTLVRAGAIAWDRVLRSVQ
jgi:L-threonylcarbamoyladenylate synthase